MAESLSQHSNLTGSNGPISMALAKLSYCTTSTYQKRLQWEHLHNRNGMFVVFDIIRRREARGGITEDRVIKLIVNSRLTEEISVNGLSYQVQLDEDSIRSSQQSDENSRVRIIVKKPLMAIRYRFADGRIRRIQMNFHLESGFHLAKEILKSHSLPIQDQDLILDQPHPPTSTQSSYSTVTPPFGSQPLISSGVTSGYPSFSGAAHPAWASMSLQPPPTSYSETHVTQQSRCMYPSQDELSGRLSPRPVMDTGLSMGPDFVSSVHRGRSSLSYAESCDPLETDSHPNTLGPLREKIRRDPSLSRRLVESDTMRPSSAPETQSERLVTETFPLSQMLPPKRVLPFPEKKQTGDPAVSAKKAIEEKQAATKETNIAEDVNAKAPKKTAARPKASKAPRARPAARATTNKPAAKKATLAQKTKTTTPQQKIEVAPISTDLPKEAKPPKKRPREDSPSESEDPKHISKPLSRSLQTPAEPLADQKPAKTVPDQILAKAVPDQKPAEAVPDEKPATAVSEQEKEVLEKAQAPSCSNPMFNNLQPEEYLTSLDSWIRKYHDMPAPAPPQTSKDLLAEYANQSEEDRTKAIDNLICDCLEDENFLKLAKDVEAAWMRIGLGF